MYEVPLPLSVRTAVASRLRPSPTIAGLGRRCNPSASIDPGQRYSQETIREIRDNGPVVASVMPGQQSAGLPGMGSTVTTAGRPRDTATPYTPPEYGQWNPDALGGSKGGSR